MKNMIIGIVIGVLGTIVVGALVVLVLGIYKFNFTNDDIYTTCTEEAKICPDGSTVVRSGPKCEFAVCPGEKNSTGGNKMTEMEARKIAEKSCIKGGEALGPGTYNEITRTWWFDANLNATKPGCNPACVVSEETKSAEINWRCTGLISPESTIDTIRILLEKKYPENAGTISVNISKETAEHARGSVSFAEGMAGGNWLAAKVNGEWQLVFDGNGQIPCSLSSYGFPADMLNDCA